MPFPVTPCSARVTTPARAVFCAREYGHRDAHRATVAGTPYVWASDPGEGAAWHAPVKPARPVPCPETGCMLDAGHPGLHFPIPAARFGREAFRDSEYGNARPGNHGQYDQSSVYEPIKIIHHYDLNFDLGNVVKYVLRAGKKPGVDAVEDLEKAREYLRLEIERRRAKS
jgi:hypothetical protein